MRGAENRIGQLILVEPPLYLAGMEARQRKAKPAMLLLHDPLLRGNVAIDRLHHADGVFQLGQRMQAGSAVEKKQVRLPGGRGGPAIEPEFAEVSELLADPRRCAQAQGGEIDVLDLIGPPKGHIRERRPRAETRKSANERAQDSCPGQRGGVAIMMRPVRGVVGDLHHVASSAR